MRTIFFVLALLGARTGIAQNRCETAVYEAAQRTTSGESAAASGAAPSEGATAPTATAPSTVIKIPVVVHVVYKDAGQNIFDAQIISQIEALNKDFRRTNADAVNTPERFRSVAADAQFEFYLATADPRGRPTTGIIRRQTSITYFMSNDRVKASAQGGSDAWDTQSYLNIWVCNLISGLGYSSIPGTDAAKDGIVMNPLAFGTTGASGQFIPGRIATHEVGHWLGLKHIWGDAKCGDDGIGDTPQQASATKNCPSGIQQSCNNGEAGDMYMNFMDYTSDACMNLFTEGQKTKMRSLFATGGARAAMLQSKGLLAPWAQPDVAGDGGTPVSVYPNPAMNEITVVLSKEWLGKTIYLFAANGGLVQRITVAHVPQKVDVASLKPGLYFFKTDRASYKFIKL